MVAEAFEPHARQGLAGPRQPLGLGNLADLQAVGDVLFQRHMREERVVLEDGVHIPLEGGEAGHVPPGELDGAAGGQLEAA